MAPGSALLRNDGDQPSDRRAGIVFLDRSDRAPHGGKAKRQGGDLSAILGVTAAPRLGRVVGLDLLHVSRQSVHGTRMGTMGANNRLM
jgi:hypothetical protein